MKHFWTEFNNPLKNGRFELEIFYIRIEFNDLFSEIRLVIFNVLVQYLRSKVKL
jgi:hypothetical protein